MTAGAGVSGNGTAAVTITGTAAEINTALAGLSYTGNLNFNGLDTLTVTTGDGTAQDIDTIAITVNPVNDAPVNTVPGPQSVNEDATLAITGVSVADPDAGPITTTLTVTSGRLNVTAGAGVSGNGSAAVTITGTAAEINTALAGLSYTGNPNFNGPDTLTVTTGDGTAQDIDIIAITVNPVTDAPVNTVPGPKSVNEDTLLTIGGVSVADVDSSALTTTLTTTSGTLDVTAGAGVSGNGSAAVTITGTAAEINTALAGLSYTGNLNFNGLDTLTVTTGDGTAQDIDTIAITVNPVNDAPVNTVPGPQSVNEDSNHSIAGLAIADVDAGAGTLTATLSVTHGTLTVASAGGAGVSGSGTGSVMLTGTVSQINTTLAAANNVVYRGLQDYNGPDTLTVSTSDGGNAGSGGALTDVDTVAITLHAVNDRPLLDLDANNSSGATGADYTTKFTEGGGAVAVADLDDLIADVDNPSLASATITLANHHPGDVLDVMGALPAGITASPYDPSTGVLALSGAATLAAYQTALHQVVFSSSSPIPSATDRIVNIVVNDGAASSVAAHAFVHVVPVDTAPALDLDADDSSGAAGADYTAVFTGGGAAVPIADVDTLIADADSPNLVSATITLTNGEATDFLSVNGALPTGIISAFDPLSGVLTLSGSAPVAAYQAALHQIEFDSSVPIPLTATRVIEVVVNDGVTGSDPAFSLIHIALAASPTLDLDADNSTASGSDYATTFTEGGGGVTVADTDILFSSPTLVSATITLTNLFPGDLLSVTGALPAGVTAAYDPGTGVMTLTGPASAATFQAASEQIVYSNTTENPATDDRIITVVVNDGINDSNTATAIVKIVAVNDPPSLSVSAAASYTENDAATLVSPVVTISDPDSPNLTIGVVAITDGLNPGDVLTAGGLRDGTLGTLTFNWAPSLNELIVIGKGSLHDYETLFQSVRFHSDSDDPTNAGADTTRTISWAVFDGTSTVVSTTTITISAVNDAPVAQDGSNSGTEDTTINGMLVATDVDSPSLTYGLDTQAAHGAVVVNPNGSYTYTPNRDFNGADSFTFTANDGTTGSNAATVSLTVNPVNDAPSFARGADQVSNEDAGPQAVAGWATAISAGPADEAGQTVAFLVSNNSNPGLFAAAPSIAQDGTLTYTPGANAIGSATITVHAHDSGGTASGGLDTSADQTFIITINAVNDAPVATNGAASGSEDTVITGTLLASDIDSASLAYSRVANAAHGNVTVNANGTFSYTPNADFNGADSFSFKATDGTLDSNVATVSLTVHPVNDAPVATDGAASGSEDAVITGTLQASDIDSASLTYGRVANAAHGSVTVNANGTFSYTPNTHFDGADSFSFKANDGALDSNVATVSLTVNPVNDAPVAANGAVSGYGTKPITGTLSATDINSDALTFAAASQPAHGTLALKADGTFAYNPVAGFSGTDSFTFKANDGVLDSNVATETVTVSIALNPPSLDVGDAAYQAVGLDVAAAHIDSFAYLLH